MSNTRSPRYSAIAIGLHWALAALILGMIWTSWYMHGADGREVEWIFQLHKSFGITILLLTIARIIWRVKNPPPPLPDEMAGWEKKASNGVHMAFYAVMILVPLGGWGLASLAKVQVPTVLYGTVSWPHLPLLPHLDEETKVKLYGLIKSAHSRSDWLIYGLLALHIGGALKHEFGEEDGVLKRMIPSIFGKTHSPDPVPSGAASAFGAAFAAFAIIAGGPVLAQSFNGEKTAEPKIIPTTSMTPNWSVISERSEISFTFTHDGDRYQGRFPDWDADILFMADNLGASRAIVTVDLPSVDIAKKLYTDSLKSEEWFDSAANPAASVDIQNFSRVNDGYVADASLTIKNITTTVPFKFSLKNNGSQTLMTGSAVLTRKALNLGQISDPAADWVSDEIIVNVTVAAIEN